jgi:hypothetical protein
VLVKKIHHACKSRDQDPDPKASQDPKRWRQRATPDDFCAYIRTQCTYVRAHKHVIVALRPSLHSTSRLL